MQYLPNGDCFLIGARTFTDIQTTRVARPGDVDPEGRRAGTGRSPLDHKISEGVAISRKTMKIAWSNTHGQYPDLIAEGESVIYTADIVYDGGSRALANKKEVLRAKAPECTLEAQDFRNDDTELIYTCYRSPFADVFGIDLEHRAVTTYRKIAGEYNEVEGIFPDGEYTLVESSREQAEAELELHRHLEADARAGQHRLRADDALGRLSRVQGLEPRRQPRRPTIAFQSARNTDAAGVGYGIFLLKVQ